jgi:hypothetical protein
MPLFDHTGDKLAAGPALLLPADPGAALLDAARLYDPHLRRWHGRLVFSNGVLLFFLRHYAGAVAVEDVTADSYAVSGKHIGFYTAYWSPRVYRAAGAPPALGPLRKGPLHHWDLNTGMPPGRVSPELQLRLAEAALALAGRAGGIAIDMFGFRFDTAQELVSVSERTPAP